MRGYAVLDEFRTLCVMPTAQVKALFLTDGPSQQIMRVMLKLQEDSWRETESSSAGLS
jgi:hypothetical protein